MLRSLLLREALVLTPLLAAQAGICVTLFHHARRHPRMRWLAIAVTAADAVFLICMLLGNLWMIHFEPKNALWRAIVLASGPGFVWMFPAAPAYVFYLIWRWWRRRSTPGESPAAGEPASPERRKLLEAVGTAAIASPFAVMAYGILIGRLDFQVREIDFPIRNLPPDLQGLRILQLSDIHLGMNLSEKELARVVDASNQLRPHLAIMTGDLITAPEDPMDVCIRQLARVRSDAGMWGCLGNHEMYVGKEEYAKEEAAKWGIDFLRMENRPLRFGNAVLNLGGVDYQNLGRYSSLAGAASLLVPGATNVLLSHNPDVFPVAAKQGWDATLSGHTHGGQVTLEIAEQTVNIARFYTPYVAGAYRLEQAGGPAACYVTRGIGTIGLPARVGVPPEITLLRLRKA